MEKRLNNGGETVSDTPSIDLLNRRLGTSPAPRMLTESEKKLLRQGADEIAAVVRRNAEEKIATLEADGIRFDSISAQLMNENDPGSNFLRACLLGLTQPISAGPRLSTSRIKNRQTTVVMREKGPHRSGYPDRA